MLGEQLVAAIQSGKAELCVSLLKGQSESARREASKAVIPAVRQLNREANDPLIAVRRAIRLPARQDAASAAVLGTATLSEIKRMPRALRLFTKHTYEVLADRLPQWLGDWADWTLGEGTTWQTGGNPETWAIIRRLVREGLIPRPSGDEYIVAMIGCFHPYVAIRERLLADEKLLDYEVWRVFEVEGTREASLAAQDKYSRPEHRWSAALQAFAQEGKLDRQRLLTASLGALQRDFAAFHAGWFAQFHEALAPTVDERAERVDAYLALVTSRVPATVSFALRALAAIDKAGRLPARAAAERLAPALTAREKGTVTLALRLLACAAKREPFAAPQIALIAADALVHPAADVQSRALDLLEACGASTMPHLRGALAARADDVAHSLRARVAAMVPEGVGVCQLQPQADAAGETEELTARAASLDAHWAALAGVPAALMDARRVTLAASALRLNPVLIPRLDPDRQIEPVQDVDALVDLFAAVIENGGPPDDIERVLDGVSRLCAERPADFERRTSALRKRARGMLGLDPGEQQVGGVANTVCRLALAWIDGVVVRSPFGGGSLLEDGLFFVLDSVLQKDGASLFSFFERRASEVSCRVAARRPLPLLSAPTHAGGWIDPRVAVERFRAVAGQPVRRLDPGPGILGRIRRFAAGTGPSDGIDRFDVIQALLRLAPDGRPEALRMAQGLPGELGAVLRYALGGEHKAVGGDAALWVAAARARDPLADDLEIESRFPGLGPAAGRAARVTLAWVKRDDGHTTPELTCEPPTPRHIPADMPTVMHYAWRRAWYRWEFVVWSHLGLLSTVWPLGRSAWHAFGATTIGDNMDWWEARWGDQAYLELMAEPDASLEDHGLVMLAFGLAGREPTQAGAATDVLIAAIGDGRITAGGLGAALARASRLPKLVHARWARTLGEAARVGPLHLMVVRGALEELLASAPDRKPAEMVALLELEHELCVQTGVPIAEPAARAWLQAIGGGGKTAKLAKALCALGPGDGSVVRQAALEQLRGRVERAERWQQIAETWKCGGAAGQIGGVHALR